ncbi:YdcF family protein [Alphaproteobacteria bacterium KMM 3653]|uniref:YdcF family protein n=1 Tax=Harenicola maris TaxID=2841044 RepID=A0AAP2CPC4_9RHOB|nr:YdcF family protein [Harenicola maris]
MRRVLRALLLWGALAFGLTLCGVLGATYLWPDRAPEEMPVADVIVCLGAGMDPDGTLHAPAVARVRACADLHAAGRAPRVLFTGGRAVAGGPSAGERMAELAVSYGVPRGAVSHEDTSLSTLQNALFSQAFLPAEGHLILVTEAFHLPRSWASFKWAGGQELSLYMSERVRVPARRVILREVAAIGFNALRVGAWSAAHWAGLAEGTRDGWLD